MDPLTLLIVVIACFAAGYFAPDIRKRVSRLIASRNLPAIASMEQVNKEIEDEWVDEYRKALATAHLSPTAAEPFARRSMSSNSLYRSLGSNTRFETTSRYEGQYVPNPYEGLGTAGLYNLTSGELRLPAIIPPPPPDVVMVPRKRRKKVAA